MNLQVQRRDSIVFDLDGTMFDTRLGILSSLHHAFTGYIEDLSVLQDLLIGPPLQTLVQNVAPNLSKRCQDEVVELFKQHYDNIGWKNFCDYEGLTECLLVLRENQKRLFLATNKRETVTINILREFDVFDAFEGIVCSDSVEGKQKSKSEMIASLIEQFDISARDTVYVGDTVSDFYAANENNIEFIGVMWGYEAGALKNVKGPPFLVSNFSQLTRLLVA